MVKPSKNYRSRNTFSGPVLLISSTVKLTLVGSHPVAMNFLKRLWIHYNKYESILNHPLLHLPKNLVSTEEHIKLLRRQEVCNSHIIDNKMLNVEFNVYMASIDNKEWRKTVSHSCWYHCSLIPRLLVVMSKDKCMSLQENNGCQERRSPRESDKGWADEDHCPWESMSARIAACEGTTVGAASVSVREGTESPHVVTLGSVWEKP